MPAHRHRLEDSDLISQYLQGGHGKFTIVSKSTGTRFTYKMACPEDDGVNPRFARYGKPIWIKVLTSNDNEDGYRFVGTLWPTGYRHGRKTRISENAPSVMAIRWFLAKLDTVALDKVEFWHEGTCGKCGRTLTVPESIERGLGPVCAKKAA